MLRDGIVASAPGSAMGNESIGEIYMPFGIVICVHDPNGVVVKTELLAASGSTDGRNTVAIEEPFAEQPFRFFPGDLFSKHGFTLLYE